MKITSWLLALSLLAGATAQSITIYSGRNEAFIAPMVEAFEDATGISVEVRFGGTAELAATILEEGNNSPADIFFAQDAGALGAIAKEGMLQVLPDEILEQVPSRFRSRDGWWIGLSGRARVLTYNTDNVNTADLPDSIFALTEETWRGRVGWAPENGSFQSFVTAMRIIEGEDVTRAWLRDMLANDVKEYRNNTSMVEAVGRGEIDISITNHYYLFRFLAEQGESFPARNHYLSDADIGSLVNIAGVGILSTSANTEAALSFVDFMLQPLAQQYFTDAVAEHPMIDGVETNPLLPLLVDLQTPELDLSDLDDLEGTLELLIEVGAF